jgi:hypothetical protein
MKKSIMAILNRHSKKKKHGDDSEDDVKENQVCFLYLNFSYLIHFYRMKKTMKMKKMMKILVNQ